MANRRYFEYLYTHPNNPISKLLREVGDFFYRNFTSTIDEQKQKIVDLTTQTLRTAISLNQYKSKLEEENQLLREQTERERSGREEAMKAWSQQYDLAQRLPKEIPTRVFEIQRRVQKSRTPRIWADLEGTIHITNLPKGNLLVGRNLNDYLIETQFPDTRSRSYENVTAIQHNNRIYEIMERAPSVEGELLIGTMMRLKRIKGSNITEVREGLLRRMHLKVIALYKRRHQTKPQET